MTHQRAPFRLLRAAAVAAAVLFLAAWAHIMAGGQLPAAPVMAAFTVLVLLVVVLLTRWKLTATALTGILGAGQGMLHEAFSSLSEPARPMVWPDLHLHGSAVGDPAASAGPPLHRHLQADFDLPMLGVHIIATLVTAVLLAKGEAALWALAAWLRPLSGLSTVRIMFVAPRTVPRSPARHGTPVAGSAPAPSARAARGSLHLTASASPGRPALGRCRRADPLP